MNAGRTVGAAGLALALALAPGLSPAGAEEAVALLAATCGGCHAAGGVEMRDLAGTPPEAMQAALEAYRSGARTDAAMRVVAGRLTEAEIGALSRWFAP